MASESGSHRQKAAGLVNPWRIIESSSQDALRTLESSSVQTCVTSPPYFGLRDYGHDGQIGLEATPDEYVAELVAIFREVRRVLADDGTLWLNLGDSYSGSGPSGASYESATTKRRREQGTQDGAFRVSPTLRDRGLTYAEKKPIPVPGTKPKDLLGIPWMVAFALRADGWYLRSDIIWSKPNPMPESVTDRPTKAHEYLFLLSKSPRYFYDAPAIAEDAKDWSRGGPGSGIENTAERYGAGNGGNGGLSKLAERYRGTQGASAARGVNGQPDRDNPGGGVGQGIEKRNKRSVWTVTTMPYPGAHFATFPPKLIEPCILAGSREGDTVLDPFSGAGTTGMVALRHGRAFVGIELNPEYAQMARDRILDDAPLLNAFGAVA